MENNKLTKRILFFILMAVSLLFAGVSVEAANIVPDASIMPMAASSGIKGNGTNGIYIDINAAPYTTYAQKDWGQYAYGREGCAWFASARVNQITGKNTSICAGTLWYSSAYSTYGFSRGSSIKAPALACFGNHVVVIERIDGNTVTVSEGGVSGYSDASHGYCVIRTTTVSDLLSGTHGYGSFLGYVYLPGGGTPGVPTARWSQPNITFGQSSTVLWNRVDRAQRYILDGWYNGKEIVWRDITANINGGFIFKPDKCGKYSFFVIADNGGARSTSKGIELIVTPEVCVSQFNRPAIKLGEESTLNWSKAAGAEKYILDVWHNGKEVLWKDITSYVENGFTYKPDNYGIYSCFVIAVSGNVKSTSKRVELKVVSEEEVKNPPNKQDKTPVNDGGTPKGNGKPAGGNTTQVGSGTPANGEGHPVPVTDVVKKARQPMKITVATKKYSAAKLKKKARTFKIAVKRAKGKVTYKSSNNKYVKVTSKGKVTVRRKTPKGTYKITVRAGGNKNYKAGTKTVTIKVK